MLEASRWRYARDGGQSALERLRHAFPVPAGQAGQTNDLGEFRITGLPAANTTWQRARGRSRRSHAHPCERHDDGDDLLSGAPEISAAQRSSCRARRPSAAFQFLMMSAPAFSISGVVVDDMERPLRGAMVSMMPCRSRPRGAARVRSHTIDGTFTLSNVIAGTYRWWQWCPCRCRRRQCRVIRRRAGRYQQSRRAAS